MVTQPVLHHYLLIATCYAVTCILVMLLLCYTVTLLLVYLLCCYSVMQLCCYAVTLLRSNCQEVIVVGGQSCYWVEICQGRQIWKPTQQHQASWAELSVLAQGQPGQVSVFRLYCNWFVLDFTLMSVSIYLFYLTRCCNAPWFIAIGHETNEKLRCHEMSLAFFWIWLNLLVYLKEHYSVFIAIFLLILLSENLNKHFNCWLKLFEIF